MRPLAISRAQRQRQPGMAFQWAARTWSGFGFDTPTQPRGAHSDGDEPAWLP